MLHFQMEIEKACQMEDSANCYCKITQLTDLVYPFNEAANNRLNADPKAKDAITKKWINNRVDCETAESAASQGITLEGVPLEEIPKVTHGG